MIGRKFASVGPSQEEEYLARFIESAVDPEDLFGLSTEEDDFISLFIAHSQDQVQRYNEVIDDETIQGKPEMKYSKFISNYSRLDPGSGIGLIRLSSVVVPATGMTVYSKDATLLCYSLVGEGEVIINGTGLRCRKYDFIWLDCSQRAQYRAYPGKPWECAFVRINGELRSKLFENASERIRTHGVMQLTFGAGTRFRSLIWQLLSERTQSRPNADQVYSHLLLAMFVELELAIMDSTTKQVIVPDIVVAIQSYLDINYSKDISLDELSRIFSISKFHMSREFKRYIGKSPNDYLIDIRLNKSKELLVDSKRTIAEIGQLVGIPNTNHFLYLFKNREGITPSAFRKRRI